MPARRAKKCFFRKLDAGSFGDTVRYVGITGRTASAALLNALTARNLEKARAATAQIHAPTASGAALQLIELDLASLASVRACADRLLSDGEPFNLVIANAGVMAGPKRTTVDGFETQFGTNHLGHFVLINRTPTF